MKLNPKELLFGTDNEDKGPVLLAVTPPRTGERTLLGVENLLQSIAVPEPFSLELAGDMDGVTLMARCLDDRVVRGQLSAHYPQARIQKLDPGDDPLRLEEGEQAWAVTLRADGPEYLPLRTFRDDDLLDPGSDPLIALMARCPPSTRGSASWRGCCCAPSAPTGRRPTWTRPTSGPAWSRESPPTPFRPSPCRWTASRWPSSASAPWPPSRDTCGCRTARYGRRRSWGPAWPWAWRSAAGHGTAGRRPAAG